MLQFVLPPQVKEQAAEIERFRARHRRLLRAQQQQQPTTSSKAEGRDEDDGRKRKISANWRLKQQQQQTQTTMHQHDSSEMIVTFNAFDFSTSPEAFQHTTTEPLCNKTQTQQQMDEVAKQVTSMGFHCAGMWGPPANYCTCDDQQQDFYGQQPQCYAYI